MKNLYILSDAINYIEENLCEPITQEDIAANCYSSLSSLQKNFRYAFHHTLKEYISKRRLTHAAKELVNTDLSVIDIAIKYQYNSPEVFTRAFSKLWGTSPSNFKHTWKFTGIFPKIIFEYPGGSTLIRKKVDISELYDVLKSKLDTYIVCFDIVNLTPINEISHEAGDKAILECLKRIDENADEEMLLFRIGGDEFALVTGLSDKDKVDQLIQKILNLNGSVIHYDNQSIPVSMWAGATMFQNKNLRYHELFQDLQETIDIVKN